jgi:tetratricopeptide (TPR) repeat protein
MRARRLVALVIVLAAQAAVAQPQPPQPPAQPPQQQPQQQPPQPPPQQPPSAEENRARALKLFEESAVHYKNGEFEKAAELLREAHGLFPEPLLIYNLARALESMGDLAGAIENYERYLAEATKVEDRGAIERRIATLKQQLAKTTAPVRDDTPTPPVDERPPNEVKGGPLGNGGAIDEAGPPPSMTPWFVVGGGVAVLAAGGVFGYLAGSAEDDAHAAPVQEDAARLLDDARRDAKIANILLIGGGVVAAGGLTWAIIEQTRGGSRPAPTVAGARLDLSPSWVRLTWELP